MENKTFQIGDTVTWTSQAGGNVKTKTGKVVAVVPTNIGLRQIVSRDSREYSVDHLGLFSGRDHESYLIQVGKSKRLYWPLVKYLKKVEPEFKIDPSAARMAIGEVRPSTLEEIAQREKEGWRDNPDYDEPQW